LFRSFIFIVIVVIIRCFITNIQYVLLQDKIKIPATSKDRTKEVPSRKAKTGTTGRQFLSLLSFSFLIRGFRCLVGYIISMLHNFQLSIDIVSATKAVNIRTGDRRKLDHNEIFEAHQDIQYFTMIFL